MSRKKQKTSTDLSTAMPKNEILLGNCIDIVNDLPSESLDMVFADPPYNLQLGGELHRPDESRVDGVTNDWDRFESFMAYDDFCEKWLSACHNALKSDGTIWVIGSYHNIFRLGKIMQDMGFWILNDVIWRKTNPMPNFRGRRFTNAHETLIWASKSEKSKYTFNYQSLKAFNDDIQMRSDWEFPLCTGQERLKKQDGAKLHPTQKPESLLYRIMLASTNKGDTVLDPFFGTGTTGAVAKKMGRHFIGVEQDKTYAREAQRRIDAIEPVDEDALQTIPAKQSQPRIPFGSLIETGLIKPGTVLYTPDRRLSAQVRADGSITAKAGSNKFDGSIHKVGAALQGRPSCNGWTFWHMEKSGKPMPIDSLRQKYRETREGK